MFLLERRSRTSNLYSEYQFVDILGSQPSRLHPSSVLRTLSLRLLLGEESRFRSGTTSIVSGPGHGPSLQGHLLNDLTLGVPTVPSTHVPSQNDFRDVLLWRGPPAVPLTAEGQRRPVVRRFSYPPMSSRRRPSTGAPRTRRNREVPTSPSDGVRPLAVS